MKLLYKNVSYQLGIRNLNNVIQFPNKLTTVKTEHKALSMSCCKTDMLDWNFDRGVF